MSNVRRAVPSDLPEMLELANEFFDASAYTEKLRDYMYFVELGKQFILDSSKVAFVWEKDDALVGMIIGSLVQSPYNPATTVAIENMWWVKEEHRNSVNSMKLLKRFEEWGKAMGADIVTMVSLEKLNPEKIDKIYTRYGYSKVESTYMKEI